MRKITMFLLAFILMGASYVFAEGSLKEKVLGKYFEGSGEDCEQDRTGSPCKTYYGRIGFMMDGENFYGFYRGDYNKEDVYNSKLNRYKAFIKQIGSEKEDEKVCIEIPSKNVSFRPKTLCYKESKGDGKDMILITSPESTRVRSSGKFKEVKLDNWANVIPGKAKQ